ncbi:hypothetical protein HYW32_01690 [Candidatus Berkelbacteria bacterium]|nr:hypothetical protein [Candidatus Berkelbacteria bacterium]
MATERDNREGRYAEAEAKNAMVPAVVRRAKDAAIREAAYFLQLEPLDGLDLEKEAAQLEAVNAALDGTTEQLLAWYAEYLEERWRRERLAADRVRAAM